MTGNPMKPRQKRLDGYVLPKPKRAIIGEKLGERACHNLKIAVFAGDGHRRLESTGENRQSRHNTMLLGEYRLRGYPNVHCARGDQKVLYHDCSRQSADRLY